MELGDDVEHRSRNEVQYPLKFKPTKIAKDAPFPSLFDVLFDVDERLGYNVEVKWPQPTKDAGYPDGLEDFFEINRYCDEIISMTNRNSGKRFIYYSSFSADVCTCLAMKQSTYPVFQLTNGDTGHYPLLRDTRVRSMGMASAMANFFHFSGIVTLVNEVLENQGIFCILFYFYVLF